MICASGGSISRLAKAAGAEPADQLRDEKLHAVVARSTFPSQNGQNTQRSDHFWKLRCRKTARCCGAKHISKSKCTKHHSRTTFGSWDVEKVHAVVAQSTFPSQNVQNTPFSDHFWKFRCRKSARRCGAKHISKSKCTKHLSFGAVLEVAMSKKCTPLWREAHFQVKMFKALGVRTTFGGSDVDKVHAVVARSTFRSQNVQSTRGSDHFWRVQMSLRFTTLHYTTLHYITQHYTPKHYNYDYTTTQLHSTTLQLQLQLHNYTPLHSITLHCTTLHTPLHYPTFHYTSLHYITLQLHNYTLLHSTTLNYTTLLHYPTLHYIPLHYITLHYITLNDTEPQIDR